MRPFYQSTLAALLVAPLLACAGCSSTQNANAPAPPPREPDREASRAAPQSPPPPKAATPSEQRAPAGQPPRAAPPVHDAPPAPPPKTPPPQPAEEPVAEAPAAPPPPPNKPAEPAEPERWPRYASPLESLKVGAPLQLDVQVSPPNGLRVATTNVRRLRLAREGMPLSRQRSIALRIDGQGFEWTPRYSAIELEFSPNGAWAITKRYE